MGGTRSRAGAWLGALAAVGVLTSGCGMKLKKDPVFYTEPCEQEPGPGVEWAKCSLKGADLAGANLKGALIHNVDLREADLTDANLRGADIANVYADDAVLFGADLRDASINGGTIQKAKFCGTQMPAGNTADGDC